MMEIDMKWSNCFEARNAFFSRAVMFRTFDVILKNPIQHNTTTLMYCIGDG